MALSFTGFVGFVLTFYLSVLTLREPGQVVPNWQEHFLIIPIGMVIQAIPGFPGGLGIGEAGFGGLYKLLGCEYSLGVLGSLVQRVIAWIIAGGGYLVYLRMKPALAQAVEQERADPVAAFAAGDLPCPP
jgi:uncharacterized membrane protein YbhN (UPF0104 family)